MCPIIIPNKSLKIPSPKISCKNTKNLGVSNKLNLERKNDYKLNQVTYGAVKGINPKICKIAFLFLRLQMYSIIVKNASDNKYTSNTIAIILELYCCKNFFDKNLLSSKLFQIK